MLWAVAYVLVLTWYQEASACNMCMMTTTLLLDTVGTIVSVLTYLLSTPHPTRVLCMVNTMEAVHATLSVLRMNMVYTLYCHSM